MSQISAAGKQVRETFGSNRSIRERRNALMGHRKSASKSVYEILKEVADAHDVPTGENLRQMAKTDPLGFIIESATNFLFDNMQRTAHKTGVGAHFGPRTPAEEAYQGRYVNKKFNEPGLAGARRPVWRGGAGQLYVVRSEVLHDAAYRQAGKNVEQMLSSLDKAAQGDKETINTLLPAFKEALQETIAHEMLHSFRDTEDSSTGMQHAMNASANQMLDAKTQEGTTLREEMSQYFEGQAVDNALRDDIEFLARDARKLARRAHDRNYTPTFGEFAREVRTPGGPAPIQASIGSMLANASKAKGARKPVKGALEHMVDLKPRIVPKEKGQAPLAGLVKE
jgi:hypothetical protein